MRVSFQRAMDYFCSNHNPAGKVRVIVSAVNVPAFDKTSLAPVSVTTRAELLSFSSFDNATMTLDVMVDGGGAACLTLRCRPT